MADKELTTGFIRARYRDLEPLSTDDPNKAYAEYISAAPAIPLGHTEFSANTTPQGLPSIPVGTHRVILYAFTNDLTYTDDGTTPSATHGMIIPNSTVYIYDTDVDTNFQVWAASATDVRVSYYG